MFPRFEMPKFENYNLIQTFISELLLLSASASWPKSLARAKPETCTRKFCRVIVRPMRVSEMSGISERFSDVFGMSSRTVCFKGALRDWQTTQGDNIVGSGWVRGGEVRLG